MTKLADIDGEIRVILKLLAVAFTVVVIIFLFVKGGTFMKDLLFPTPPAPPEQKFGKLPKIQFSTQNNLNLDYNVNTLTGTLPSFPDRINVYKIKRDEPNLVALGRVRENLRAQGFSQNETKIGETIYQWTNDTGDTIEYNLITNSFKITSNFLTDPPPIRLSGTVATKTGAYNAAMEFLQNLGEDVSDIDPENVNSTYLKIDNGQLIAAENQNDAQFIKISLFQKNIDEDYKIYYPKEGESTMSFIFRNEDDAGRIVQADFNHLVTSPDEASTYPIITSEQAFEELKKGDAIIFNQNTDPVIDIADVTLGYYLGEDNQEYLVPIIIFSGKNFKGYVPVVSD